MSWIADKRAMDGKKIGLDVDPIVFTVEVTMRDSGVWVAEIIEDTPILGTGSTPAEAVAAAVDSMFATEEGEWQ